MYNDNDFCPIVIAKGSTTTEAIDYIAEAKLHGFTAEDMKGNFDEIVRYIDDCNKNDYRPF